MNELNTKIGDHLIRIKSDSTKLIEFFHENYPTNIELEDDNLDLVIIVTDGYGIAFKDYEVEIHHRSDRITYRRADYLIEVNSVFNSATISVYDELALKHAMMNLYSSFAVYHNWGLLIHSSCAVENGMAHIFSGQSGAGKSTAARLSYPRQILSDEATLVKITSEGIKVYNSPFRSEVKSDKHEENIELASVQILYQALQNKRTRVSKSDAIFLLMDKVFFWPYCQEETKRIMGLVTSFVKAVPVYKLHFQKNNTFWELIS